MIVVAEASNGQQAIQLYRQHVPDIVLMDLRLPVMDGTATAMAICKEHPEARIIMLSTYDNAPYVKRALADGASGYLLKDATPEDLEQAIKVAISGGGNVLSPKVIQNLFEATAADPSAPEGSRGARPAGALTQRETDILALLAEGKSNRDISRALYLSEKTVKAHLAAIFRKLGVTNRTQAAMAAVSMGIGPDLRMVDTGMRGIGGGG